LGGRGTWELSFFDWSGRERQREKEKKREGEGFEVILILSRRAQDELLAGSCGRHSVHFLHTGHEEYQQQKIQGISFAQLPELRNRRRQIIQQ